jgi:hypothetical protein
MSELVANNDEHETNQGFEYAHCCRQAVLPIQNTRPIDEGINDIAFIVDKRIIQVEDLVEACVQNITKCKRTYNDNNWQE